MKTRILTAAAALSLFGIQLSGCSESPQPVDAPPASSSQLPPGHPPMATAPKLPPGSSPAADPMRVTGTIVFEDADFQAPEGTLYVSVHPKGTRMPLLSRQYALKGAIPEKNAEGVRSLPFELTAEHWLGQGANPGEAPSFECDISAKYKENFDAMSKTLAEAVAVYQPGKTDYTLTLKRP